MSDQEHQAITRSELVESLAEQFPQLLPRDVELASCRARVRGSLTTLALTGLGTGVQLFSCESASSSVSHHESVLPFSICWALKLVAVHFDS